MSRIPDWAALRLGSLELIAGLAVFVSIGWRRRAGGGHSDAPLPATLAAELRVEAGGRAELFNVLLPVTIGRSRAAGIVIADPHVSRLHARIGAVNGEVFVTDLDSRNGTSLNARPIEGAAKLDPGDEIRVGRARIAFRGVSPWK